MLKRIIVFGLIISVIAACRVQTSVAIQKGKAPSGDYSVRINTVVRNGLIFIPVKIGDTSYNFLFDSGAPNCISTEIQDKMGFKIWNKSHIVDTDNNRKETVFVKVDSMIVGGQVFANQSAFVTDMKANPVLSCLKVDGILGSNLMRFSNWIIDYQEEYIDMTSQLDTTNWDKSKVIPFSYDNQYNISFPIQIGKSEFKHLHMDYGSNGAIALKTKDYASYKEANLSIPQFINSGTKNSGIIGKEVNFKYNLSWIDSLKIGEHLMQDVEIRESSTGLIGYKVLANYKVSIDWNLKRIYLEEKNNGPDSKSNLGFSVSTAGDNQVKISSVIQDSPAEKMGLRPAMLIKSVNGLHFPENNFCDFVDLMNQDPKVFDLVVSDSLGTKSIQLEKSKLY